MSSPIDGAPITERVTEFIPAQVIEAPGDDETVGLDQGYEAFAEPTITRDTSAFAERSVRRAVDGGDEAGDEQLEGSPARLIGERVMDREATVTTFAEMTEARHGILSRFADLVAGESPETAARIRDYRDAGSQREQDGDTGATDSSAVVHEAGVLPRQARALGDTALAERGEKPGKGQQGQKVTTAMCGKMSDLVGMEDPDGLIGGFFRDLAIGFLPFGKAFETDYNRACREWFESHPGVLY